MKIGSKLALYKLKLEYDGEKGKIYKATAIENFSVKTPYGKTWEQHFINNIVIYTDLELEIANFDVEIEPKVIRKKDGTTYEIKQSPLCFDRISNREKSIIRVLDFEYKITNKRDRNGNLIYNESQKKPYVNEFWYIYKCEYNYKGWKLNKKTESKIDFIDSNGKKIELPVFEEEELI